MLDPGPVFHFCICYIVGYRIPASTSDPNPQPCKCFKQIRIQADETVRDLNF